MMGLLTASGSLARALGPMVTSVLYQHYGPYVTFTSVVVVLGLTILLILVCSPRLVPYHQYTSKHKVFVQIPEGQSHDDTAD
jgi:ceroid-lipofuscinosis MFS transporter 7